MFKVGLMSSTLLDVRIYSMPDNIVILDQVQTKRATEKHAIIFQGVLLYTYILYIRTLCLLLTVQYLLRQIMFILCYVEQKSQTNFIR
jgi:hypothetical protein